ncbi:uncharacterized protein LOC128185347, partial [Crassostrea angulata]|uniref:uncharacterized protein LOC128185347 n=1 Tax=Magallana angulata TaxID=2784310 RepID=UPI0022B0FAAB
MAASVSGGMCRLCWGPVPLKYRRLIFSSSFKVLKQLTEVLNYSPSQNDGHSHYLCYVCFNKLNKLEKIDFDVENKLNALAVEKASILQELRNKNTVNKLSSRAIETSVSTKASVGISSRVVTCPNENTVTPTKCINRTKRTILHTPTPRKSKVHILGTPRKTVLRMETSASSRKRPQQLLFSPMKAKISYRGQNDRKVRTKIIREKGLYSVMVGIVRGNKPEVILNKLVKVKNFKEKAVKVLSKCVKEECKLLCGKNDPSILRGNTSEDIISIDFLKIANELKEKAPAFSQILEDTMNTTKPVALVSSAAVILHHRNQNMSLIHHAVGQLLDHGGATDETIDLLRCLGFSVGCSATHKKHVSLIDIQKKKIENTILCQVHQSSLQCNKKKTKE